MAFRGRRGRGGRRRGGRGRRPKILKGGKSRKTKAIVSRGGYRLS